MDKSWKNNIGILALASVVAFSAIACGGNCGYRCVKVTLTDDADALQKKAVEVFERVAATRIPDWDSSGHALCVQLVKIDTLSAESFIISKNQGNGYEIAASEGHRFLYGLGELLHRSTFDDGLMHPGNCLGYGSPDKPVRGIYLATHFGNFYNNAPVEEVEKYIEELSLWGYNALQVWFDMHHYTGMDDPEAVAMIERLVRLLAAGKAVGMESGLTMLANEGYSTTPARLRTSKIDWTGYYDCQICPSAKGGTELILSLRSEMLECFSAAGVHLDNVWLWPYDQGGCSCKDCSPWGANGYLKLTRKLSELIRSGLPEINIVLSTWLFDFEEQDKGEWKGLADAFSSEKPWADCIMADSHTLFPRYLLSHKVPGNLPLINFPEISMYKNRPWGAYGSNLQPERFDRIYHEVSGMLEGGFPYSEGKFEDINKVLYSRMYWDDSLSGKEIFHDYVCYEFTAKYADMVCDAVEIMEKNMDYDARNFVRDTTLPRVIMVPGTDFGARKAYELLQFVDSRLPQNVRDSWRWRLLYIRAELDFLLRESEGVITEEINRDFGELVEISHLQTANFCLRPPFKPE